MFPCEKKCPIGSSFYLDKPEMLWDILVVYHLHGQTGLFTVRANGGRQNRIYRLQNNGRESLKLVSFMALKKRNRNFRLNHSDNRTTFSEIP